MFTSIHHLGTGLLLSLAASLPFTLPAQGAPNVAAQASATATGLTMDGVGSAATHVVKVADVTVSTDGANGLTLSITSGTLAKGDTRTPVAFQVVLVADGASAPSTSAFTTPSGTTYTFATSSAGSVDRQLYIKYTPAALQDPGTYSAIVGLEVRDN